MQNIVILISGRGSNFEAILRTSREENWESACNARIAAVISNRPQAAGLDIARAAGIEAVAMDHKAYDSREAFEAELADIISRYDPAVIVLFVFMAICQIGSMMLPQFLATQKAKKEAAAHHKKYEKTKQPGGNMMIYMMVFILVISVNWPAAMTIYWAVSSLVMIFKTLFVQFIYIDKK